MQGGRPLCDRQASKANCELNGRMLALTGSQVQGLQVHGKNSLNDVLLSWIIVNSEYISNNGASKFFLSSFVSVVEGIIDLAYKFLVLHCKGVVGLSQVGERIVGVYFGPYVAKHNFEDGILF